MKTSIFLGDARVFRIYHGDCFAALQKEADLEPTLYTKDDVLKDPQAFSKVENIFTTWGMPAFTEEEIRTAFPSLRAVYYAAGSVRYFAAPFLSCGVRVHSAWAANAVPVAEYTTAQILLANKGFFKSCRLCSKERALRDEAKRYAEEKSGNFDASVGIIGAGMIGKMVIRALKSYDLKVLAYDKFLSKEELAALGAEKVTLDALFSRCDTISNHIANLPETVGMLRYEHFSRMKKNATFINTGRGAQVVEEDLLRALLEEPDRTAILDVTDPEPPFENSKLYNLPNVFLTPHIAGSSGNEVRRMGEYMLEEYRRGARNERFLYEVTPKMLETMA